MAIWYQLMPLAIFYPLWYKQKSGNSSAEHSESMKSDGFIGMAVMLFTRRFCEKVA
jgi:hypothetical protein